MSGFLSFAKTTMIGGLIFLVPLILIAALLAEAYSLLHRVTAPLAKWAPVAEVGGVAVASILALLLLVLLCFLIGLLARTTLATRFKTALERKVLDGIPIYAFVKSMVASVLPSSDIDGLKPVIVRFDDLSQVGFEIERTEKGNVVVYLPGAPNPWSGSVCIVEPERVAPLQATALQTIRAIQQLGLNAKTLLGKKAGEGGAAAPEKT